MSRRPGSGEPDKAPSASDGRPSEPTADGGDEETMRATPADGAATANFPEEPEVAAGGARPKAVPSAAGDRRDLRRRRLSPWFAALMAGLIGGAAGSAAWLSLGPVRSLDPQLQLRLEELERGLLGLNQGLQAREQESSDLRTAFAAARAEMRQELASLADRLAALEEELRTVRGLHATVGQQTSHIEELRRQLAELDRRLADRGGAAAAGAHDPWRSTVEGSLAALRQGLEELERRVAAIATSLAGVTAEMGKGGHEVVAALESQLAGLVERTRALEQSLSALRVDQEEQARRLTSELETKVVALRQELETRAKAFGGELSALRASRAREFAVALAMAELAAAAVEGKPYADALRLLESVADDPAIAEAVSQLGPFAATGIPTPADLLQRLEDLAPAMTANPAPPSDDLLARTRDNLSRLIVIRRLDEAPAADQRAIETARQKLARGDLEGAEAALRPLAESGDSAAREWIELARARRNALEQLSRLATATRARLAASVPNG